MDHFWYEGLSPAIRKREVNKGVFLLSVRIKLVVTCLATRPQSETAWLISDVDRCYHIVSRVFVSIYVSYGHAFGMIRDHNEFMSTLQLFREDDHRLIKRRKRGVYDDLVAKLESLVNPLIHLRSLEEYAKHSSPFGEFDADEPKWLDSDYLVVDRVPDDSVWDQWWEVHRKRMQFETFLQGQHKRLGKNNVYLCEDVLTIIGSFL